MGKCKVTKFNGTFPNDNLPLYNKLKVSVTTDYEDTAANTKLVVQGGTKVYPSGVTPPDADHVYYDDYGMLISDKYNITKLDCGLCVQLDTKELSFLNCTDGFTANNLKGNFSDLAGLKCSVFSVKGMQRAFNISEFLVVDAPSFNFVACPNATGLVESFGEKTDLVMLYITESDSIGGDLFELAKRQINAGRDECTGISMPYLNVNANGLLFNGESVQGIRKASNKLSWTYDSGTGIYTVTLSGSGSKTATYQKLL